MSENLTPEQAIFEFRQYLYSPTEQIEAQQVWDRLQAISQIYFASLDEPIQAEINQHLANLAQEARNIAEPELKNADDETKAQLDKILKFYGSTFTAQTLLAQPALLQLLMSEAKGASKPLANPDTDQINQKDLDTDRQSQKSSGQRRSKKNQT